MARSLPRAAPAADDSQQQVVSLPKIPCDPLASLPPTEILVDCVGQTWTIPPKTAHHWLKAIWTDPFDSDVIFPGFVQEDEIDDALLTASLDSELDDDETFWIALEVLEVASGYSWWFTIRLVTVFGAVWGRLGGMLLNAGVDSEKLSLGAWISAALDICMSNLEPKKAAELLDQLLEVPESERDPDADEFDLLEDSEAFYAAMNTAF